MILKQEAVKATTLVAQCYATLESRIINGNLQPGQKLKIDELSIQLDVGHSPIREALSRLAASGLVEAQDNKGFRVAQISETDVRDTYRTFFQIEMLALEQAIDMGDDAWESGIVAALYHLGLVETHSGSIDYGMWTERNYAFHRALIAGCNSRLLMQLRSDVYRRFDRYCRISFNLLGTSLEGNHKEHKKLADAVLKRNKQKVSDLMHKHIFGAMEDVIAILKANNKI